MASDKACTTPAGSGLGRSQDKGLQQISGTRDTDSHTHLHDDLAQRGAVGGHVEEDPGGCHYFRFVRRRIEGVLVTMLSSAE